MKLDLNISEGSLKAPKPPLVGKVVREITESDIHLASVVKAESQPSQLQRITDRHHALARNLAQGMKVKEAAFAIGMGEVRASQVSQSPAFQELLTFYREKVDRKFESTVEHMAGLSRDATILLRERLEDNPDRFSNNELLRISVEHGDRGSNASVDEDLPDIIELRAPDLGKDDSA